MNGPLNKVLGNLRSVLVNQDAAGLGDGDLVNRYVRDKDEAAFAALVRRHGPMVMGVCRRVLHHLHDAEDAFQATFLVLVRKAATLQAPAMIGNWLYGVAYRTALEARKAAAKRRAKEAKVAAPTQIPEDTWADLRPVLDQELDRLPDKYRAVVVLCDLEGKTRREAARHLGCPEGTVASRLASARTLLAKRLLRHGLSISGGALAAVLSQNASASVTTTVVASTTQAAAALAAGQAAAGLISANILALTEGVVKSMFLTKLKIAGAVILAIAGLLGGLFTRQAVADKAATPKQESPPQAAVTAADKATPEGRRQDKPEAIPDAPAPGYRWVFEPQDGRGLSWAIGRADGKGVVAIEETDKEGALLLTLAHPAPTNRGRLPEFRPVAFDEKGNREVLDRICGGGTGQVAMNRFRLDPKKLPAEKVKRLGVEMLRPEGVQLISRQALARAKKEGVEVLPPAQVGEKYDFVLTTRAGVKLRSNDLRGKVVLFDCWSCT
jgi:RNA polymerase sigma factor (sigma-70 family)